MRKKIKFYKGLLIELIETLCTICLYLERDSIINHSHGVYGVSMRGHFQQLKRYSQELRKDK